MNYESSRTCFLHDRCSRGMPFADVHYLTNARVRWEAQPRLLFSIRAGFLVLTLAPLDRLISPMRRSRQPTRDSGGAVGRVNRAWNNSPLIARALETP